MRTLKAYIIIGHRKEQYDGQYAPEILEIADEWTMEGNPEWLIDKYKDYENSKEFNNLAIVSTEFSLDRIKEILYPSIENTGINETNLEE